MFVSWAFAVPAVKLMKMFLASCHMGYNILVKMNVFSFIDLFWIINLVCRSKLLKQIRMIFVNSFLQTKTYVSS